MPELSPKRFIAGAVCPKCLQKDKTVMYQKKSPEEEAVLRVRECVACGFYEEIKDE